MTTLPTLQRDIRNVLLYAQELVGLKDRVILDVTADQSAFYEHALLGLPGIEFAPAGDAWMRLKRLRESRPPLPDPIFTGWFTDAQQPDPGKPPALLDHRILRLSVEEISDLAEADLIDRDDVMLPRDADGPFPPTMDVVLRTSRMTEFRAAWQCYVDGPWTAWAEVERPRRRSIQAYNTLYQVQQRVTASGEDNAIELVWGIGMARWRLPAGLINAPVIDQLVELDLLEDGSIVVTPRQLPPAMALKPFHFLDVEGSKRLQKDCADRLARIVDDPDIVFSPFERSTFEPLLRSCAAQLSATGTYIPDEDGRDPADRSVPPVDETLRVSDTWILYVRRRAEDFRKEDIARLITQVERAATESDLPAAALKLVRPPSSAPAVAGAGFDLDSSSWRIPEGSASGWSSSFGTTSGSVGATVRRATPDFFFPLSHNEDQREILRRLEEADGVLVQGPPGTGKTHTIANVICHYLAMGRRVLVTAKTAEALTALHEKLPVEIRDLAISIIHTDREGSRQLEHAIEVLANEAKTLRESDISRDIQDGQRQLADIDDRIAEIDDELLAYAGRNLDQIDRDGEPRLPMQIAADVLAESGNHAWFDDAMDFDDRFDPKFSEADVAEAAELRRGLGSDIAYALSDFVDPAELVGTARLLAAHDDLARERVIDEKLRAGAMPSIADFNANEARRLLDHLDFLNAFVVSARADPWPFQAYGMLCGTGDFDGSSLAALKASLETWRRLADAGRRLAFEDIDIGDAPSDDEAFDAALERLVRGERPFGLLPFRNGALKARVERVTVAGSAPSTIEQWEKVRELRAWQRDGRAFVRSWSRTAAIFGLPPLDGDWNTASADLMRLWKTVDLALRLAAEAPALIVTLGEMFPYGVDVKAAVHRGDLGRVIEALRASVDKDGFAEAKAMKSNLASLAGSNPAPVHRALAQISDTLGDTSTPASYLAEDWSAVRKEVERLATLRPARARLDTIAGLVRASGAPKWAARLRSEPGSLGYDQCAPSSWRKSWEWSRANGFIRGLADRGPLERLSTERGELDARQRKLLLEVVRLRTFLGLKKRMTDVVQVALARFASAVARLGAGTGKAAGRHRRVIRDATLEAAAAVPCWILPEWRVSEQLPANLCDFDLVIIDEASQSDITALPAILRGKKLLIVGDDKQVSPVHVGLDERTVVQLRTTYLDGLPFADQMDPATSLYELGGMLFPGKAVLLREHFRCVEPIIRFSSRFYQDLLVPMRLPTATERLDPPLVDVLVRDGRKRGDTNKREGEVVVEEVRRLVEDPAFADRTIGVISLIGDKQAKAISDALMKSLGAEVIERHRIMCGNAAHFQGQERSIVILSMVACPKTATAQRSRMFEQRFNVAMSRARDRVVLVRSVTSSDLKSGDLKLAVIEHFRNPVARGAVAARKDLLQACDSGFERDFGSKMITLGYRIRAQVPVAGFRLDFVIEGANDARLAVELDGDQWHGPDRWADDFKRQTALERLGWTFWRCWGSSWVIDKEGCLADLTRVLTDLGIEPIGAEAPDGVWTEFREVGAVQEPGPLEVAQMDASAYPTPYDVANDMLVKPDETLPPTATATQGPVAAAGDLVVIRFDDDLGRAIRIRLSATEHKPDIGIVHVGDALGMILIGRAMEEEIIVPSDAGPRQAVIEMIEKARIAA